MSVLREHTKSIDRRIGEEICRFANGACDCQHRDRLCERVEAETALILRLAAQKSDRIPHDQATVNAMQNLIGRARERLAAMTPAVRAEMRARQRESFARDMSTPCEHGELDFEQCPQCRAEENTGGSDARSDPA